MDVFKKLDRILERKRIFSTADKEPASTANPEPHNPPPVKRKEPKVSKEEYAKRRVGVSQAVLDRYPLYYFGP